MNEVDKLKFENAQLKKDIKELQKCLDNITISVNVNPLIEDAKDLHDVMVNIIREEIKKATYQIDK